MVQSVLCYIDIANNVSADTGVQLFPLITNTTFLSKYIKDFPKQYTAFPSYLRWPGAGINISPLSAAYNSEKM